MKSSYLCILAALMLAPSLALAAQPGTWTGPYAGIKAGLNQSSADNISSENAFTAGLYGGYDWQLSRHLVFGGSVFYVWNQDTGHTVCSFGVCGNANIGTNVYGVDGRVGFPLGLEGKIMPYIKIGYAHVDFTGELPGDDNSWRYGAGVEWRMSPNTSLVFEYTRAKYGSSVDNWKNANLTVGASFRF